MGSAPGHFAELEAPPSRQCRQELAHFFYILNPPASLELND